MLQNYQVGKQDVAGVSSQKRIVDLKIYLFDSHFSVRIQNLSPYVPLTTTKICVYLRFQYR